MTAVRSADDRDLVLVADPCSQPNPQLVVAAIRAGALGVLDVPGDPSATRLIAEVTRRTPRTFAIRVQHADAAAVAALDLPEWVDTVMLAGAFASMRSPNVTMWGDRRVLIEVISRAEVAAAIEASAAGVVAKGCESGGRIGDTEGFVLAQQVAEMGIPFWLQGGIGEHTAAAAVVAGAVGVVLDGQLALVRESSLDGDARSAVEAMDGSETRVIGGHRVYVRPDLEAAHLSADTPPGAVADRLGADLRRNLMPLGQDAAAAASLASRYRTAGGVVQALRAAIVDHIAAAAAVEPLAHGAGIARSHGIRYPIAQGPMTRVSDRAEFAAAVAEAGALPFLALALLSGPEVRELLTETAALLGERPWGVGVLGFVPPDVRAAQLEVIHDIRPPVALIAGGRPSQARPLEDVGIPTYLHVPSPALLDRFLRDGARRFVFEGRECGGHVGPRTSLPLWDAQVERLLAAEDPEQLDLLFAGGIHDARSAAMVATVAAPLARRGARVGVLMGTAYLFTAEAVSSGAITAAYQDVARTCDTTVLLETSPGHATRCVETDYVRAFATRKAELDVAGVDAKEMWTELEALNLGRLRVASKGRTRQGDAMVDVDEATQRREGMYMIGQVATLRDELTTAAELHEEVTTGATMHLNALALDRRPEVAESARPLEVAVVGMAAMFPGAADVEQYWANVVNGVDCVTEVPPDRWDPDVFYDPEAVTKDAGRRTPSKWGGFLPWIPFDALAYGIPPRSLGSIESVQLLSLEVARRALADAGYDRREFDRARTSVIFGTESGNDLGGAYSFRAGYPHFIGPLPPELDGHIPAPTEDSFPGVLANVIAGRIANRLDLGGVNYTVDAACAASLTALDTACKELTTGSSDMVICGGADVHNGINDYLLFASVHALSPTGRCRTFDSTADGIALGEGVACVILKRLADAERDGDRILAVVEGVAGSSDGRHLGLTAPRKEGQMRALERAYSRAGISPSTIGLAEAHGTGTVVGDRTELATLTEVFSAGDAATGATVLGSVKSQIGHTKCTAGLAGLIKTVRAVHAGVLPPTLHIESPNDFYDSATSPFRFHEQPAPWPSTERRAAVSAFGFGGTNFHVVLRSHHDDERPRHGVQAWPAELFLLRAETAAAGDERLAELRHTVERIVADDPGAERHRLRDLARTVSESGTGDVRYAIVAEDFADLTSKLSAAAGGNTAAGVYRSRGGEAGKIAFLHPGQGSQRVGMLSDLFVTFPELQSVLQLSEGAARCMFPGAAFSPEERAARADAVTDTRVAQPALGLASLAATRLLRTLGVEPDMAGGHSYGELTALATAGVFDDATLLQLSEARGEAIVAAAAALGDDPGAMAAVSLSAEELRVRLPENVVLANHNGPRQAVVSGPTAAVDAFVDELTRDRISSKRLNVAAAFHSQLVAGACDTLAARLDRATLGEPSVPVWSNATAAPYPSSPGEIRALLAAQVGQPVRFVEQVEAMYREGARIFVEAGPGRVLTKLVDAILDGRPHVAVACDSQGEHGVHRLLLAVAELAAAGVPIDVRPLFQDRAARVDLATLPVKAPGWRINGHLVCTSDGAPVPGGLRGANQIPEVTMNQAGPSLSTAHEPTIAATGRDGVVAEYLRAAAQIADAQRDVMLTYLRGAVPTSHGHDSGNGHTAPPSTNGHAPAEVTADAEPPAPLAEPDAPAAPTRLTRDELLAAVLGVVSARTGYPLEMLDPDLDLEADLSIDSIKRVEIIGELTDTIGLAGVDAADGVDEAVVEELAQLKTLRAVVAWLDDHISAADVDTEPTDLPVPASRSAAQASDRSAAAPTPAGSTLPVPPSARRAVPRLVRIVPAVPAGSLAGRKLAVIGRDWDGLDELCGRLKGAGATVEVFTTNRGNPDAPVCDEVAGHLAGVDGIIHLGPAESDAPVDARDVFAALAPAISGRASMLLAATTTPRDAASTMVTGVAGLMRSLALELPDRHVRAVELPAAVSPAVAARILADELMDRSGPSSVTYTENGRATRQVGEGAPVETGGATVPLDAESVVVITGGARGITARAALALVNATGCSVELLGRSPLPQQEDPRTAGALDRPALRRTIAELGELTSPAEIDAACGRILGAREIAATLSTLEQLGRPATYHQVDVCDAGALAGVLGEVRARRGRIDAMIHGAGVLDDRLARDKTVSSYGRVFATKVDAARTLLEHAGSDVRLIAFFGSVSGVFGNRGQVDYSAANDALDELARRLNGVAGRRVVSLDWGPWGGTGMVSPELEREYARRGIGLLDPDEAVGALLAELATNGPAQVVVIRAQPAAFEAHTSADPAGPPAAAPTQEAGELTLAALTEHG